MSGPSAIASDIALEREGRAFVVCETTQGTLEVVGDSDLVRVIGPVNMNQAKEQVPNAENRDSRSLQAPISGRLNPGDWSLPCYIKPVAAGSTPNVHPLLLGLFGTHTVTPATKVVYSFTKELPTLSIWYDAGHTVFRCRGATVSRAEFSMSADVPCQGTFSGQFMEMYWAGTDQLDGSITLGDTDIVVDDASKYTPGSIIVIESEQIQVGPAATDVNTTTNTLSNCTRGYNSTTAAAHADNTAVYPWIPDGTNVGSPVHGKRGIMTVDGSNVICINSTVSIENNINYLINERNGVFTAEAFTVPQERRVTVRSSRYFRSSQTGLWTPAQQLTPQAIVVPGGDVAGSKFHFDIATAIQSSPNVAGDPEKTLDMEMVAYAADGSEEGEATLTFD